MKRYKYQQTIQLASNLVFDRMLGLSDKTSYEEWTTIFSPTSTYEGDWKTGSKMLFVSINKNGEREGMISKIIEHRNNQFVSIQHYGMLKSGNEITSGPEVEDWSGSYENYSFEEKNGETLVSIEIDGDEKHQEYMDKLYPTALLKLKEVCERGITEESQKVHLNS